jgi:hypothetical protein
LNKKDQDCEVASEVAIFVDQDFPRCQAIDELDANMVVDSLHLNKKDNSCIGR